MVDHYSKDGLPDASIAELIYANDYESGEILFPDSGRWHAILSKEWINRPKEYDKFMFYGQSLSVGDGFENLFTNHDNLKRSGVTTIPIASGLDISEISANSARARYPTYLDGYKVIADTNGFSGYTIEQLSKGQSPYTNIIANMTRNDDTYDYYVGAIAWLQGESNYTDTQTYYYDLFETLINDFFADTKTETGQTYNPKILTYQMAYKSVDEDGVPLAHLQASEDISDVYMVCPMYFLPYVDGIHPTAVGYNWLAEYFGRVYYKTVEQGLDWKPTSPISLTQDGANIDILMNVPTGDLVIDQTTLGAITDDGFKVTDDAVLQTINSVSIVDGNTVRITLSTPPTGVVRVRYGLDFTNVLITAQDSSGGTIRDSETETVNINSVDYNTYNWLVMFDKTI